MDNTLPPGVSKEEALEGARRITEGTLMDRLGLEWLEVGTKRLVARIPVEGNTQPYGILHGGATASLCETIGSFGAVLVAGLDKAAVGLNLTINHLRPVTAGHVTATGVPVHAGRTTAVWDMRVEDDDGRLVAVSRLTLAIRDQIPGAGAPSSNGIFGRLS
ncbi:MAG: PaaI family thioesterase [Actinomycetota bacterium]